MEQLTRHYIGTAEIFTATSDDLSGQAMLVGVADWLASFGQELHWVVVYIRVGSCDTSQALNLDLNVILVGERTLKEFTG